MRTMEKVQDLIEEAKRRTILWIMFAFGLAYLLSLTRNSIWQNIPVATIILAVLRYLSFELEICKRVQGINIPPYLSHLLKHQLSLDDPLLRTPPVSSRWRRKIDSPVVDAAVNDFTWHIVQEFFTDLWYSSLSPDKDVPEQLCILINDIFGEIAQRVKRINLINLLTRDVVDLVANHLELFRQAKIAIGVKAFGTLSSEEREENLKAALLRKSQLHPAIFSPEFECKVLQQLMGGVITILLKPQDAQCALLRGLARELLACAVLRPVMNFASPSFINKSIENAMLSAKEKSHNKKFERGIVDDSVGLNSSKNNSLRLSRTGSDGAGYLSSEEPYIGDISRPFETQRLDPNKAQRTSNRMAHKSLSPDSVNSGKQGDWAQVLDVVSQRRTRTLAPENLDNLWAKGRNYKKKEFERGLAKSSQAVSVASPQISQLPVNAHLEKQDGRPVVSEVSVKCGLSKSNQVSQHVDSVKSAFEDSSVMLKDRSRSLELPKEDKIQDMSHSFELPKETSDDSVLTRALHVHGSLHDKVTRSSMHSYGKRGDLQAGLSNMDIQGARRSVDNRIADAGHGHQEQLVIEPYRTEMHNRYGRNLNVSLEDRQKSENSSINQESTLDYWDAPSMPISTGNDGLDQAAGWLKDPVVTRGHNMPDHSAASKLNCWVVGAHLVKDESQTFAVFSIAVTDSDNNTWFVERRFRNFEQLHRYLRDFPQYNLQLPPKRIFSSSLDDTFVRDRCILLDKYLKDLLAIPSIAELHEVWDFLSVSSKTYAFSKSSSVMKTLAVNVDDAVDDMFRQLKGVSDGFLRRVSGTAIPLPDGASSSAIMEASKLSGQPESHPSNMSHLEKDKSGPLSDDEYGELPGVTDEGSGHLMKGWHSDGEFQGSDSISHRVSHRRVSENEQTDQHSDKRIERLGSDGLSPDESTAGSEKFEEELAVPPEWTPPKLTVPLLNLVDSIFQLQRRGWIRRQVFWMAKQILQLGMGDAVDDWMVTQIQYLRREDVVASSIRWVQEILWPGGVFITKAKKEVEDSSLSVGSSSKVIKQAAQKGMDQSAFFESQLEASRCASVVHEILVEGGPAALVSLIGRRQYTRCAKDIYYFLQSTVFLKQLTYSVLETLLIATFPELTHLIVAVRQGSSQVVI